VGETFPRGRGPKAPVFVLLHRGALGDFALAWPALFRLRERHPRHRFIGIGKPGHLGLAKALGLLEDGIDSESAALLPFFRGERLPGLLKGLERPGSAALLWMDAEPAIAALLRRHGVVDADAAFHPPFPPEPAPGFAPVHVMDHHLDALGPTASRGIPGFKIATGNGATGAREENVQAILLHPGSGSARKNFTREFYASLAERLPRLLGPAPDGRARETRILLGPAEADVSGFFRARFPVEEPESPLQLALTVARAALFVGNDSGPAHVAALLGTPTLAFYRVADPAVWGVRGPHALSLFTDSESHAALGVERALKAFPFESGTLVLPR
jgi:hypothetical protein